MFGNAFWGRAYYGDPYWGVGAGVAPPVVVEEAGSGARQFSSYFLPAGRKASDYEVKPPEPSLADLIDARAEALAKAFAKDKEKKKKRSFFLLDDDFDMLRKR